MCHISAVPHQQGASTELWPHLLFQAARLLVAVQVASLDDLVRCLSRGCRGQQRAAEPADQRRVLAMGVKLRGFEAPHSPQVLHGKRLIPAQINDATLGCAVFPPRNCTSSLVHLRCTFQGVQWTREIQPANIGIAGCLGQPQ